MPDSYVFNSNLGWWQPGWRLLVRRSGCFRASWGRQMARHWRHHCTTTTAAMQAYVALSRPAGCGEGSFFGITKPRLSTGRFRSLRSASFHAPSTRSPAPLTWPPSPKPLIHAAMQRANLGAGKFGFWLFFFIFIDK